jgi:hypothetical protein
MSCSSCGPNRFYPEVTEEHPVVPYGNQGHHCFNKTYPLVQISLLIWVEAALNLIWVEAALIWVEAALIWVEGARQDHIAPSQVVAVFRSNRFTKISSIGKQVDGATAQHHGNYRDSRGVVGRYETIIVILAWGVSAGQYGT